MADTENLNSLFASATTTKNGLESDVLGVLESILRLYSITPQELFYKWESYCLKMGVGGGAANGDDNEVKLDLNTARMFQKDVRDGFEKGHQQSNQKNTGRGLERKGANGITATPKPNGGGDVFGMLDELTPNTIGRRSGGSIKRKQDFESPVPKKVSRPDTAKKTGDTLAGVPFSQRPNAGQIMETLNSHLPQATAPIAPYSEARVKPIANTDVKKFGYKPMSMRLSDSSEILDERIDEFMVLVQKYHNLDDSAFGNPAAQSTNEIVAIGRIASDTLEGKLNVASLVLETSRRMGAGLRVSLKLDSLQTYSFFPGQIVAVRGMNASGQYFSVTAVLPMPKLPMPVSSPSVIDAVNTKLGIEDDATQSSTPLNVIFASGPYTADDNLDFEPLETLCQRAIDESVDAMVLTGPFLDIEHPLLTSGDFDIPDLKNIPSATMSTLFRLWISSHLERLCLANPSVTVILVPSVRDALSKHVSWPQEQFPRTKDLGLPKQVKMLPNPCFISLNETVFAISSQDILYELSREQISHGNKEDLLTRMPGLLVEQRHFFPLFPAMSRERLANAGAGQNITGSCLDIGYLKLGEWLNVRPDVLVLPSALTPSVKVVESVMVVNPGSLSKRKGAGTFSQMSLQPRIVKDEERGAKNLTHNVYERARVDVIRI